MSSALAAFMASLIDYAGLFPPATLAVPAAVAEYAGHRQEPEAWMLGRFIAPAGRLAEIGTAAGPHLGAGPAWGFSVLVGARDEAQEALRVLAEQADHITRFEADHPGQVRVECLETAIPADGGVSAQDFVPALLSGLRAEGLGRRDIFLEIPSAGGDSEVLAAIAAAVPSHTGQEDGFSRIGAKLRCGGVTPGAFPSCERIAAVIHECARLDLPLKCTAGLHHPVRHRAAAPDVMMHGFLNVFGAGLLAWSAQADLDVLVECVTETDPAAFAFTGDTFAWRDHRVDAEAMRRIRSRSLSGFGSCSFNEPRADLQTLGLL